MRMTEDFAESEEKMHFFLVCSERPDFSLFRQMNNSQKGQILPLLPCQPQSYETEAAPRGSVTEIVWPVGKRAKRRKQIENGIFLDNYLVTTTKI